MYLQKHHYHELTLEMQNILGSIPHEFTNYWISKFPHLISHAYHAFSICSNEPIFQTYYNSSYHFTRPEYFDADDDLYPTLLQRDPKPLLKQSTGTNNSPKKSTQQNASQAPRQRNKGAYNFRKSPGDDELSVPQGLQRNFDNATETEDDKRDVFANFKFRRNPKTFNRNNYNNINNKKDKNVTWTLNPTATTKEE